MLTKETKFSVYIVSIAILYRTRFISSHVCKWYIICLKRAHITQPIIQDKTPKRYISYLSCTTILHHEA